METHLPAAIHPGYPLKFEPNMKTPALSQHNNYRGDHHPHQNHCRSVDLEQKTQSSSNILHYQKTQLEHNHSAETEAGDEEEETLEAQTSYDTVLGEGLDEDLYKPARVPDQDGKRGKRNEAHYNTNRGSNAAAISPPSGSFYASPSPAPPVSCGYRTRVWKPSSIRVSPSKWDDAEKWVTNAEERSRRSINSTVMQHPPSYITERSSPPPPPQALRLAMAEGGYYPKTPSPQEKGQRQRIGSSGKRAPVALKTGCDKVEPGRSSLQEEHLSTTAVVNERRSMSAATSRISTSSISLEPAAEFMTKDKFSTKEKCSSAVTCKVEDEKEVAHDPSSIPSSAKEQQQQQSKTTLKLPTETGKDTKTPFYSVEATSTTTRSWQSGKCSPPARHNTPAGPSRSSSISESRRTAQLERDFCVYGFHGHRSNGSSGVEGQQQWASMMSLNRSASHWSSREEEERESEKSLRVDVDFDVEDLRTGVIQATAYAWEEAERAKCLARIRQEEMRIDAWEDHQKAKAEAELIKLERKLEKMRKERREKIMKKLGAAQKRAEERRAAAKAEEMAVMKKMTGRLRGKNNVSGFLQVPCCSRSHFSSSSSFSSTP